MPNSKRRGNSRRRQQMKELEERSELLLLSGRWTTTWWWWKGARFFSKMQHGTVFVYRSSAGFPLSMSYKYGWAFLSENPRVPWTEAIG